MQVSIRPASPADHYAIQSLLTQAGLPTEDLNFQLHHFFVAASIQGIVGCVGIEIYQDVAVLRSLAVVLEQRETGIGRLLCKAALRYAEESNVKEIYLLTETAPDFFRKLGFAKISRNIAPPGIQATTEFQSGCCSTATCMVRAMPARPGT